MSKTMGMDIFCHGKGIVTSFLLGVCVTYVFLAVSNPSLTSPADGFPKLSNHIDRGKPASPSHDQQSRGDSVQSITESQDVREGFEHNVDGISECCKERVPASDHKQLALLLALWEASRLLALRSYDDPLLKRAGVLPSRVPRAPHLENCKAHLEVNRRLDAWDENGTWPAWTLWKGQRLGLRLGTDAVDFEEEDMLCNRKYAMGGPYPPWVEGADEDNLPMTRRVQRDIWRHQHPKNCQDPKLRFLLADWEIDPGFGMGAQIVSMAGMLAIAVKEQRILVTKYFNRADHEGCVGSDRSHWSCYFFIETSQECRDRALLLASQPTAWEEGLITAGNNYTSRQIWTGKIPKCWGKPWEQMQPTTQIDGKLLLHHKASDRRWWRAQAVRYLMRFPSEYMCSLLNFARHEAFGVKAAAMVLESLPPNWPEVSWTRNETDIEQFVWDMHKPWVPRPLLSLHVRQGDKAREMKVVGFQGYMNLAQQLRNQFPQVRNIWLSTEMQDVIEESKLYSNWDIYFTNISRQVGNMSMPAYEASLGREVSTNYPLVNFLMAADADFFIGALGSTWCYLIDGMRTTSGRVMAGYLSVNKYRFW